MVGHAGLLQALAMLLVAYVILALTVLSVCAIATNGAVRGGGAYCILSRGRKGVWALLSHGGRSGPLPASPGGQASSNEHPVDRLVWRRSPARPYTVEPPSSSPPGVSPAAILVLTVLSDSRALVTWTKPRGLGVAKWDMPPLGTVPCVLGDEAWRTSCTMLCAWALPPILVQFLFP